MTTAVARPDVLPAGDLRCRRHRWPTPPRLMDDRQIGSVVVTDRDAVVGILTERDLLRAVGRPADPLVESVRLWMTADPTCSAPTTRSARPGPASPTTTTATCRWSTAGTWSGWFHPRPAGRGPDPARRRDRRRRAPGPRGRGGGRDVGGRRPGPRGLLPLPAVLGRRPGRRPLARGRLAAALRRRAPRPATVGPRFAEEVAGLRALPDGLAGSPPAVPRHDGRPARRPAHRGVAARVRARAGGRPTTSTTTSCGPRRSDCARWSPPS